MPATAAFAPATTSPTPPTEKVVLRSAISRRIATGGDSYQGMVSRNSWNSSGLTPSRVAHRIATVSLTLSRLRSSRRSIRSKNSLLIVSFQGSPA